MNFLDRCAIKWSSRRYKQSLVSIVAIISLIVELNVIKIDGTSYLLMDSVIGTVFVVLFAEVRGLRGVSDDMGWE